MALPDMVALTIKGKGVPVVINPGASNVSRSRGLVTSAIETVNGETEVAGAVYTVVIPAGDGQGAARNCLVEVNGTRYRILHITGGGQVVWRLWLGEL